MILIDDSRQNTYFDYKSPLSSPGDNQPHSDQ